MTSSKGIPSKHHTSAPTSSAPIAATKTVTSQPNVADAVVRARPTHQVDLPVHKHGPALESRMEIVQRLKSVIQSQVAAVQKVSADRGVDPSDLDIVFAFNLEGNQQSVCTNCANPNCPNYATNYRTQNLEADLILDTMVVAEEVSRELGTNYGVILYDEEVLVLKELDENQSTESERGTSFERAKAFRNRHEFPDPTHRGWLDQQLAKWVPGDRHRPAFGPTADGAAADVAQRMLNEGTEGRIKGFVLTLGQVPASSLRTMSRIASDSGIVTSGMAVGKRAKHVARAMFEPTAQITDAHQAREEVGERISELVEMSSKSSDDLN